MDIHKRLYIFAIMLIVVVGFFAYQQHKLVITRPTAEELRAQSINEALRRVIKDASPAQDVYLLGQIPEMHMADKFRAVQAEEKDFNLKRHKEAERIEVKLESYEEQDAELHNRNERIKNVEFTLSKLQNSDLPALPEGFFSAKADPYVLYRERYPMNEDFTSLILMMHNKLTKTVKPFSLITAVNRIFVMMFKSKDKYILYSKRQAWSTGSAYVAEQFIYIMENRSFNGTFMHELTHIYFDGFFEPHTAPRWLSEGFAVYVQSLYQIPEDNKLLDAFRLKFNKEEFIDFKDFTSVQNLDGYTKEEVLMWYAQSYSVVRYLFERYGKDDFYIFAKNLKEGMPLNKAMYRAFGMPLNTLNALEYAWLGNLQRNLAGNKNGRI